MLLRKYIEDLPLFANIQSTELEKILHCTGASICKYDKGEIVMRGGQTIQKVGVVLSGSVSVLRDDVYGNHAVLERLEENDLVGLLFSIGHLANEDVYLYAIKNCEILLMDAKKLVNGCENYCGSHRQLLRNALTLVVDKNDALIRKQCHMSQHTLRGKITSYFMELSLQKQSRQITIPYKRQEFADYLGVDRSALSAELSRMKRDGLLNFQFEKFELLEPFFNQQGK